MLRVPGVDVTGGRDEVLGRLRECHLKVAEGMGFGAGAVVLAEQVHGAAVGWVDEEWGGGVVAGVDGLVTAVPGRVLGIHVADCCAVYVVDPVKRAVALVHSGRRGSEAGIVRVAIDRLVEEAGSCAEDLVVQLSPCIRPPRYEVDFASWIRRDALECGVPAERIHDGGECTAADLGRYYSYRAERGRTGRLFALLGVAGDGGGGEGEISASPELIVG